MGYIYRITNNLNKKIYIGQTKNLIQYRWQHHLWCARHPDKPGADYPLYRSMRKYGIEHFNIFEIEAIPDEQLNEREIYWIKTLNCVVPNGYNFSLGGAGTSKFNHEEILKYFLNEGHKNAALTARYFNCTTVTVLKILEQNNLHGQGKYQPVYQIDLNTGEIINQFNSLVEVQQKFNLGHVQIWNAVNGQSKTAAGYAWCKVQDIDNFVLSEHIDSKKTKVCCVETGQVFNSIKDAVEWIRKNTNFTVASNANICRACNNKSYTSYGFHWSRI